MLDNTSYCADGVLQYEAKMLPPRLEMEKLEDDILKQVNSIMMQQCRFQIEVLSISPGLRAAAVLCISTARNTCCFFYLETT